MSFRFFKLLSAALALGGCAVHPLPENYFGDPTVAIVQKVRCEARVAIEDKAIQQMQASGKDEVIAFANWLMADRNRFRDLRRAGLPTEEAKLFYDRYINIGIALEFTFDITEDDAASAEVDFARVISGGTISLPLKAGSDRSRQNIRKFLITDTFKSLLLDTTTCAEKSENLIYPIVGSVGLRELISTFVDLNEGEKLLPLERAAVFGDQLTFITMFGGSASPQLTLAPVGKAFHLTGASMINSVSRTDKNLLNVGLSQPLKPDKKTTGSKSNVSILSAPFGGVQPVRSVFVRHSIEGAELRAAQVITQQRIDTFYDRLGTLR